LVFLHVLEVQMDHHLDIVTFATPYPPHYGGAIDVYYKLRAGAEAGLHYTLHCFTYGKYGREAHLDQLADAVYYYKRRPRLGCLLGKSPYIVCSRARRALLRRLAAGSGPILFEGLHTTAFARHRDLAHRPMILRMHNVEWKYYRHLADTAQRWDHKLYYRTESRRLRRYEASVMRHMDAILAISAAEEQYFAERHQRVLYLPAFHPFDQPDIKPGTGDYALWHGDLTIEDNVKGVLRIAPACAKSGLRLIIAGRAPSPVHEKKLRSLKNIELRMDVSTDEMTGLMQNAQVHVVESSNPAGFKIKLLAALFTGRHVVARDHLLDPQLGTVAYAFSNEQQLLNIMHQIAHVPADRSLLAKRKSVLLPRFSNLHNARQVVHLMDEFTTVSK
jgi:glycosyltransferase involved in cell wall biosynthesis